MMRGRSAWLRERRERSATISTSNSPASAAASAAWIPGRLPIAAPEMPSSEYFAETLQPLPCACTVQIEICCAIVPELPSLCLSVLYRE